LFQNLFNWILDADGDGYSGNSDCDDDDPDVNPGENETVGDGIDNNCDGNIDEEENAPVILNIFTSPLTPYQGADIALSTGV